MFEIFDVFKVILFKIVDVLKGVPMFGTNLWVIVIGFAALLIVSRAMRALFGTGGAGKGGKED